MVLLSRFVKCSCMIIANTELARFFVNDLSLGWVHQRFCVSGRLPYGELFSGLLG